MNNSNTVHPVPYGQEPPPPATTYPTVAPAQPPYPPAYPSAYPPAYPPPAYQSSSSQMPPPLQQQQQQQQQPGYYPSNKPQQHGPGETGGTAVIVVQQPTVVVGAMMPKFTQVPAWLVCPYCHNNVQTKVYYKIGGFAWLVAAILCFVGCTLGCCLIPFCVNSCKDAEHICPSCHRMLGKYHRL